MVMYPEVQRKAQEELDRIVGHDQLPDFSHRPHLPYIEAIVKETLRWLPVTPSGNPHRLREDDEYKGYHIPANATVLGNSWALLHDPEVYPDP